jgi:hypothetical protein
MGSNGLEKDIPRLERFEQIRGPRFEKLHGGIGRKCGNVDTGDECP